MVWYIRRAISWVVSPERLISTTTFLCVSVLPMSGIMPAVSSITLNLSWYASCSRFMVGPHAWGPHGYFLGRPFLSVRAHMDFTLFSSSKYFVRNFRVNRKNLPSGELSNPSRAKYTLAPWHSMSSTRKS